MREKLNHALYCVDEEEIRSNEKVKILVLKEYQSTPEECLINFKKALREIKKAYVQFALRQNALFLLDKIVFLIIVSTNITNVI